VSAVGSVATNIAVSCLLFLGLGGMQEVGRRFARAQAARDPNRVPPSVGAVESAILTLLGLLLAFTFNGAAQRFEYRRTLITQEVNAIGTAYRRLDLLAAQPRAALQDKLRRYVSERLATYAALPDIERVHVLLEQSERTQDEIWDEAVPAAVAAGGAAPMLVVGALNAMIDIMTTRLIETQAHPPLVLYAMLAALLLLSGFPAGYSSAARSYLPTLHMLIYATMLSVTVFVILDLEYPRLGLIRIDAADQNLERLLESLSSR
jgi:hypothetical protein